MSVIEARGLAKAYGSDWALRECSVTVPEGRIVALVGPNGAGKTTFLHCAVGLLAPTTGDITVLGGLAPGSPEALARVAFVAQDAPLHQHLSVGAMLEVAAGLNPGFDELEARQRLEVLRIPTEKKVGKLSGGQQAQLALTLALARHPLLLVLDEPLARLDPLARHDLMAAVMTRAAEESISVLFSSHVVSELERVADYLIVLGAGRVQMAGDMEELLGAHAVFSGPVEDLDRLSSQCAVVHVATAGRQTQVVARVTETASLSPQWEWAPISLEELVLAYLREPQASALPGPLHIKATRAEARS